MKYQKAQILAFFVCLYATLSPPFVFSAFTPNYIRALLEITLFFALSLYLIDVKKTSLPYNAIGIWLMLFVMTFVVSSGEMAAHIASAINIIIFLLLIKLGDISVSFFYWTRWYWVRIWSLASVSIIVAFVLYQMNIMVFTPFDLSEVVGSASYTYYNNIILGNFLSYSFFDLPVPKLTWYIYEPGMLSFILGINLLISDGLFKDQKKIKIFKIINLIAGVFTFSTTFYLFFISYAFIKMSMSRSLRMLRILTIPIFVALILWFLIYFFMETDLAKFTSLDDRFMRLEIAESFLRNNSLISFLFGNGIGASVRVSDNGISSGFLSVLVERGVLVLIYLSYCIYKYAKINTPLIAFIIFYHITFEMVWYPIFYIAIMLNHVTRNTENMSNKSNFVVSKL